MMLCFSDDGSTEPHECGAVFLGNLRFFVAYTCTVALFHSKDKPGEAVRVPSNGESLRIMLPNGSIAEPSRRVLLIENVQADRYLLRNWLQAEKMEVYEAVDIITGLAACPSFTSI